jgi:hypothetical protein
VVLRVILVSIYIQIQQQRVGEGGSNNSQQQKMMVQAGTMANLSAQNQFQAQNMVQSQGFVGVYGSNNNLLQFTPQMLSANYGYSPVRQLGARTGMIQNTGQHNSKMDSNETNGRQACGIAKDMDI